MNYSVQSQTRQYGSPYHWKLLSICKCGRTFAFFSLIPFFCKLSKLCSPQILLLQHLHWTTALVICLKFCYPKKLMVQTVQNLIFPMKTNPGLLEIGKPPASDQGRSYPIFVGFGPWSNQPCSLLHSPTLLCSYTYNVRPPSDVSWFIGPSNYSYKYHKP